MNVVRLPAWSEILAPESPWGLVLRSGGGGLWLLRGTAEEEDERLRVCVVAASACATEADLLDEWAAALEVDELPALDALAAAAAAASADAPAAVLVAEAERLLDAEPVRLPALLAALADAAARASARGRAFRVVFQSRFDARPDRLSVFHEFGAVDVR